MKSEHVNKVIMVEEVMLEDDTDPHKKKQRIKQPVARKPKIMIKEMMKDATQDDDYADADLEKIRRVSRIIHEPGQKTERHADFEEHEYRAGDDSVPSSLQPLHPIAALKPSVLRKTRRIPGSPCHPASAWSCSSPP